jgi:hypothetical protein
MTAPKLPEGLEPVAWIPEYALRYLKARARKSVSVFPDQDNEAESALVLLSDAQAALQALAAEKDSEIAALKAIKQAISDYHYALDTRQHGGVAQDRAFSAICNALDMHWTSGAEKSRRAAIDSAIALAAKEAK